MSQLWRWQQSDNNIEHIEHIEHINPTIQEPQINTKMADENTVSAVDESPISPIRPNNERRNSLEQQLKQRPDRSELVESTRISYTVSIHFL